MQYKFLFNKKIVVYLILNLILSFNANSDIIKKFSISGNERVSDETIIIFSKLKIGNKINDSILNESLKDLYLTNYFEDIKISDNNGIVFIKVKENPIIQSVKINGINKDSIYDNIKNITNKVEKYPFVESKINDQIILLKNILKSYGYYFVNLETSIISNKNNSVDLIYNFNLGDIAKIKNIKFIGDKIYRDNSLRNVIVSEEAKFWKFLTRNKFLNNNRINLDTAKLENFYKNRGFYNVKIKSATALINEQNQFELIFNINAGDKFYFNDIKFLNYQNLPLDSIKIFEKKFAKLKVEKKKKKKLII